MTMLRCVIVDDEPLARQLVKTCIAQDEALELCGEAADAESALALIAECKPDLLFLDVQMPEQNGLELLHCMKAGRIAVPLVIFVTAYDKYAINAFDECAVDYLLKPFDESRFQRAVASARRRAETERLQDDPVKQVAHRLLDRMPVRTKGGRIYFVKPSEIDWLEAEGNYLRLHMGVVNHEIRGTMNSFEEQLAGMPFARIHRSAIVNLARIREVRPWYTGEYVVYLANGRELTLTRTYRDSFFQRCGTTLQGASQPKTIAETYLRDRQRV